MKIKKHFAFAAILVFGAAVGGLSLNSNIVKSDKLVANIPMPVYLDVRTSTEWDEGHVDGALHFDLEKLQQGDLPDLSKDTEIKVYCRTGKRAGAAKDILKQNGFANVDNVGSYEALRSEGQKVCFGKLARCD